MGGPGSGRKDRTTEILNNMKGQSFEPKTPIASEMFLPNYSGVDKAATLQGGYGSQGSVLFLSDKGKITEDNSNLYWDDTNKRLGIGTNSPDVPLHVVGNFEVEGNINLDTPGNYQVNGNTFVDNLRRFTAFSGTAANPGYTFSGDLDTGMFRAAGDEIGFTTLGAEAMRIDDSGNVGIGTETPLGQGLHIKSTSVGAPTPVNDADELIVEGSGNSGMTFLSTVSTNLRFGDAADSSVGFLRYQHTDNSLRIGVNNSEDLRIVSNGNVGIGTETPSEKLDVVGNIKVDNLDYVGQDEFTNILYHNSAGIISLNAAGSPWINMDTNNNSTTAFFAVGKDAVDDNGTELFRVQENGNVGIGVNDPDSKLEVNGDVHIDGDTYWEGDGSGIAYGSMFTNDTITVSITDTTPVEVGDTWTTGGQLNLITFGASHYLTVAKAGRYQIIWDMSFRQNTPAAGIEVEGGIMIDGSMQTPGRAHRTLANNNDTGNFCGLAILDLAANKQISLGLINETNATNIDVQHANVSVTMVGGT